MQARAQEIDAHTPSRSNRRATAQAACTSGFATQARTPARLARYLPAVLAITLFSPSGDTWGALLQISPVSLDLSASHRAAALRLSNRGDTPVAGQVRIYQWTQADNRDVLSATDAVIASPPIIEIAPHSDQTIRIARVSAAGPQRELSYRLLIDELPTPRQDQESGIHIRLRYSVPLFDAATDRPEGETKAEAEAKAGAGSEAARLDARFDAQFNDRADARLNAEFTAQYDPSTGTWSLAVRNDGATHLQLADVALAPLSLAPLSATGQVATFPGLLGYVLPGAARTWKVTTHAVGRVEPPPSDRRGAGSGDVDPAKPSLRLKVRINGQPREMTIPVAATPPAAPATDPAADPAAGSTPESRHSPNVASVRRPAAP